MDIATLLGFLVGNVLLVGAVLIGPGASTFLDVPSFMITIGGCISATLINFPLKKVMGVFAIARKTMFSQVPSPHKEIERIVNLAKLARSEGILAIENQMGDIKDPFLVKGLQLVVDGTDPEALRSILTNELNYMLGRHKEGKSVMDAMGAFAPAFGMIGTLIGLIQMLQNLDDPSKIGAGMAVALLTTLYGAFFANLFCIPMAGKLDSRSKEETLIKEMLIEGIAAIQSGDNPRLIQEKLKSFLSPAQRACIVTTKHKGEAA
ncbi:MAG TPA: motility protein A [Candidatus Brocadiia bacterium]|nr:motility protein A [Candidatus Brocadiia bacterium]